MKLIFIKFIIYLSILQVLSYDYKSFRIVNTKERAIFHNARFNNDTILNEFQAIKYGISLIPQEQNYFDMLDSVAVQKERFKNLYTNSFNKKDIIDSARNYLLETFVNKVFPYWYGTKWCMSGTSQIPQEKSVGCSYFVSNTLYSMGFKFNRLQIAQASSRNIVRTFQQTNNVLLLKLKTNKEVVNYIKKNYKEGLFLVGLDFHVSYLLYYHGEVFMIHSGKTPNKVVIENAEKTRSFRSNLYYIGEITNNDNLIIDWITDNYVASIETFEFAK